MKNVAIVIAVHDNGAEIRANLPRYLEQAYNADVQVIVVDDHSTDDTRDILIRMKADYPRLYTTFIPASSHRDRLRLALTLGAKAAKGRWIALADIHFMPASEQWLSQMIEQAESDSDITLVAGPCRRERASLWARCRQWRNNRRQRRRVEGSGEFALPLNNVLIDKSLLIRRGELTAPCDRSSWSSGAWLVVPASL